MDAKPFAIIRVAKIRTVRQLRAAAEHNDRTAEQGTEHADPTRPPELIAGDADAVASWRAAMVSKGLDPDATRKGAVVAVEWLATASADFWANATPEQRAAWQRDSLAFVADEMAGPSRPGEDPTARAERGRGLILAAHWHEDETTPHLHVLTIPLVEKERAAKGRPRKRDAGKPRPPAGPSWGLAAKDLLGGPRGRLSELQDDYAEAMAPHGLRRGIPRKETGERNRAPAHWRAEQAELTDAIRVDRAEALALKGQALRVVVAGKRAANEEGAKTIGRAQQQATALIADAQEKAAQMVRWATGLGRAVQADAAALGRALGFPDYIRDPNGKDARAAVEKALLDRRRPPPPPVKEAPPEAKKRPRGHDAER